MGTNKLEQLAMYIEEASGPEVFRQAIVKFLEQLEDDCEAANQICLESWTEDHNPGRPWIHIRGCLAQMRQELEKLDVWQEAK